MREVKCMLACERGGDNYISTIARRSGRQTGPPKAFGVRGGGGGNLLLEPMPPLKKILKYYSPPPSSHQVQR